MRPRAAPPARRPRERRPDDAATALGAAAMLDRRVGEGRQRDRDENRAVEVERGPFSRPRLGNVTQGDGDRDGRQRNVDQEDEPPARRPRSASRRGRVRSSWRHLPGPTTRRWPPTVVGMERRRDDRQAAGHQQCAADALDGAGADEPTRGWRDAAKNGRSREPAEAGHEHGATAVVIAEAATEEQQSGQRDEVRVDRPLQPGERGIEVDDRSTAVRR